MGRLIGNDERFVANAGDVKTLEQLSSWSREPVGRRGWVGPGDGGRNLFVFERGASL